MSEAKTRTDADVAELLYGDGKPKEKEPQAGEINPNFGKRSDRELAAVVYPEQNPAYPKSSDADGDINDVIREVGSDRIIAQGRYNGDRVALLQRSSPLPHADLSGIRLAGKGLSHGNFHDGSIAGCDCTELSATWADLRNIDAAGANLSKANLAFSDLRGMKVSPETDISGCNFEGSAIDKAGYNALIKCKGANSAKGLAVREMPEKR